MEELVLRLLLAGDELDIVNEEQIDVSVLGSEFLCGAVLDSLDELYRELIALYVCNLLRRIAVVYGLAYRQEKVRLSEARIAVDEEGIIRLARILRHGDGRCMRKLIGVADDEAVKGVSGHFGKGVVVLLLIHVFVYFVSGEYEQIKITGEKVGQSGFYRVPEAGVYNAALEVRCGVQDETAIVNLHRLAV